MVTSSSHPYIPKAFGTKSLNKADARPKLVIEYGSKTHGKNAVPKTKKIELTELLDSI